VGLFQFGFPSYTRHLVEGGELSAKYKHRGKEKCS
jgi:hypothetical protein